MGGLRLGLMAAAAGLVLAAAPVAFSQTPMEDPLDARDAKRVDRMEKVVRELRDIVFKAQRTGAPVVVQPADTDARMADLSNRIGDLEQSLTKLNGSLEAATHELDVARTPEARYWWGKTLSVRGAHANAAGAYIGAIRGWPQTAWAPDAVVELSRSLIALKKPADACQTLAELGKRYPKAPAPVMARAAAARAQAKCA